MYRIEQHPILPIPSRPRVAFTWKGRTIEALEGETLSSALFAAGIRTFGHHAKDGAAQGIFCANGQCSQCLVLADGVPVKSCMELVRSGVRVEPVEGLPELPRVDARAAKREKAEPIETVRVPVLIIGGGPAGLSAAIELGKRGVETLLIDDKHRLGGKLVLQTHKFFGSIEACHAGTRGIDIATRLENELRKHENIRIWTSATVLAVFSDGRITLTAQEGLWRGGPADPPLFDGANGPEDAADRHHAVVLLERRQHGAQKHHGEQAIECLHDVAG